MIKKLTLIGVVLLLIGVIGIIITGFNFGDELPYHEKKWSFDAHELQRLVLESRSNSFDVEFIKSTDGSSYVEFRGYLEQENFDLLDSAKLSNGTLKLNIQQKRILHFVHMQISSNHRQFTVALPDDHLLESLSVSLSSANGGFDNIIAQNVEINTSSGNITIDGLESDQLNLETSSGNIRARDIIADTRAKSGSGTIKITNLAGQGKIDSSSGNIEVVQQGTEQLDAQARSGNVTITASPQFSGFYDLQSSSGNIKSPESKRQTSDLIKVRTKSGNIRINEG